MERKHTTDANEALSTAIDRMVENRLTVEQIGELVDQFAAARAGPSRDEARKRLDAAIRANHRDAKPRRDVLEEPDEEPRKLDDEDWYDERTLEEHFGRMG